MKHKSHIVPTVLAGQFPFLLSADNALPAVLYTAGILITCIFIMTKAPGSRRDTEEDDWQ